MKNAVEGSRVRLLRQHAEKIAFGASVSLLAGYLAIGALFPRREPVVPPPTTTQAPPPPAAVDWTKQALAPYTSPVPTPAADAWIGSYPTEARIKVEPGPAAPPKAVHRLPDLVDMKATATPARITIAFKLDEVKGTLAEPSTYTVERLDKAGAWTTLTVSVDVRHHEFSDDNVEPEAAYRYRISATTKDPLADRATVSAELPVIVPGLWTFKVIEAKADPDDEGKGSIYIEVTRFDKASGESRSACFLAYEAGGTGEHRVGFDRDGKSTRVHTIQGKAVTFDFDCGYDLQSVKEKDKTRRITLVSRANPKLKKVLNHP